MTGNMSSPLIFGKDSPLVSRGTAMRRAPNHEIANVNTK
jgi:hypothetical protein